MCFLVCLRLKKINQSQNFWTELCISFFSFIATGRLYVRCHRTSHSASDFEWGAGYGLDVLCARTIKWDTYALGGVYSTHGGNKEFMHYDGRKIVGKESLENLDVENKTYPVLEKRN